MNIIELMEMLSRPFEASRGAYSSSTLASYVQPGTPNEILGLKWLAKVLAGAITLGSVVMNVGRQIVEVGFRVTMYGFGLWVVSSTIKQLAGPLTRMAAVDALDRAPQESLA